jgi:oligopeptide/dipeptide ABC transporter ATP-binding protein
VMVMYAGQAVEHGPVRGIFDTPRHPYTQALLASIPHGVEQGGLLPTIEGQPPDLAALPPGCPFAARCPRVIERCVAETPPAIELAGGQRAFCWRADEP